jgi:23S rRNA (uracil1939-C5)-methyltransferase
MATHSRRSSQKRNSRNAGRLSRNAAPITVTISHIGGRGDGVGTVRYTHNYQEAEHIVFVPASLPGENVIAQPLSINKQGIKARILELTSSAPSRQTPQCNAFPSCGGCSFQHWAPAEIEAWKHQLLATHLERAHVSTALIRPTQKSPAKSRRRASFHIKRFANTTVVGFYERMGTHIIEPDGCTIIDPRLARLKTALVEFSSTHLPVGVTLEAQANLLAREHDTRNTGLCLYLLNKTAQPLWTADLRHKLCGWAATQRLSRLSIDDHNSPMILYAPTHPQIKFGSINVTRPPGAFLQATEHGEHSLQLAVAEILAGHSYIADLFAGCGTLSLPLIDQLSAILAVESDSAALAALKGGVDAAGRGNRLIIKHRNLFDLPLLPDELNKVTGVIINPPRSGALAQCQQLADANVTTIAMVSCNPASFARDAACLTNAGFTLDWVQPVDQFSYSNHLELVGAFTR